MDFTLRSTLTEPEKQKKEKPERQKARSYQDYISGLGDSARTGALSVVIQGSRQKGQKVRAWLSGLLVRLRILSWVWSGHLGWEKKPSGAKAVGREREAEVVWIRGSMLMV